MPSWKCSINILILLVHILDVIKCSRVIDKFSQQSVYVSEYCPSMPYCKEGTHVMCMFYDKDRVMGPHCLNPLNVTVTPAIAKQLLEIINAMRSKLANGLEVGYNRHYLPKAYGMRRLQWDEELATFAQVLANQCILRHDLCRASKKFPNPGQTASVVRFYHPDWQPFGKNRPNSLNTAGLMKKGFNEEKLSYAIRQSCLTWYQAKSYVTSDMMKYPVDWTQHPHSRDGKFYMSMVAGDATHMGCGLSAYVDYGYLGQNGARNKAFYDLVEVVCNFSARPAPGRPVYNINIPANVNPHSKCGCDVGYVDDDDCLCVEDPNYADKSTYPCIGKDCVPAVVILPIIAMEDAPLHALDQPLNETRKHQTNLDIFNEDNALNGVTHKKIYSHADLEKDLQETQKDVERRSEITDDDLWNVQHRYLPKSSMSSKNAHESLSKAMYHGRHSSKPHPRASLFSKSNKFALPIKGQVLKDVLPRRDFTKVQNLVDIYFNKKRNFSVLKPRNDAEHVSPQSIIREITSNVYTSNYKNATNESSDKKVLYLLDDLEQEVKHTDLAESEKKVLDAKLRKIYGRINNIPKNSMSSEKTRRNKAETNDFLKFENSVNKHLLEELQRNAHRNSYSIDNDKSSELTKNDINTLNIKKRLLEKEINSNDDLGSLKKRLEKPINENEYGFSPDAKYKTRNINALIEFDPTSIKLRDIGKETNPDDVQHRRDIRRNTFKSERYRSKNYDDVELKDYTNHLDDMGDLDYERRKYYQEKIDLLEEKIHKSRDREHHNKIDRQLRPIQPDRSELKMRPNKKKSRKLAFYPPGRSRSVHGF